MFTESVALGSSISVGQSKRGNRNIIPITGGTVTGKIKGKVVPGGRLPIECPGWTRSTRSRRMTASTS